MLTEIPAWIFTFANISIAIVFALILLNLYSRQSTAMLALMEKWTQRLAELVEKSTAAWTLATAAVVTLQTLVNTLCDEVRDRHRERP
jgi:hypothetical protein